MAEGPGNIVKHNLNCSVNYSTSWWQNQSRSTKNLKPLWVSVSRSYIVCLRLCRPIVTLVDRALMTVTSVGCVEAFRGFAVVTGQC